ncbi:MAG: LysR family transcriptional regulator [Oscillospiraceae bacterium]|nr:LysR family transcriptional regulator [Oscillospiraceae bacterium]
MDIRQLEYFISAATHLNFTKAAKECYIAQPAMSHLISAMEKQMDVQLFLRSNRAVQLTPAGESFLTDAKQIVSLFHSAVVRAQQAACTDKPRNLHISYWGAYEQFLIPELLKKFHHLYPEIAMSISQNTQKNLISDLENGMTDVVFSSAVSFQGKKNIHHYVIDYSPCCLVVYENHPFAGLDLVDPRTIGGEKIVIMDMQGSPDYLAFINGCEENGFTPNIVAESPNYENLLMMVEAEMGVTILPKCLEPFSRPGLRFLRVDWKLSNSLSVSWMKNNLNPSIPLLIDVLKKDYPLR